MNSYRCKIINQLGDLSEIYLDSENPRELEKKLKEKGHTLLSFKKDSNKKYKLKSNEILEFTKNLSILLNSNLTLLDSIKVIEKSVRNKNICELSTYILSNLQKGDQISLLIDKYDRGFTPLYKGLINVGEKTGNLQLIINQLVIYLEKDKEFREKLSGALVYPLFILFITTVFGIFFAKKILPQFNTMFITLGKGIEDSMAFKGKIFAIAAVIFITITIFSIVFFITINNVKKTKPSYTLHFEKTLLKIPFVGNFILEKDTFNFIFALSVLTKSSLNIEESLKYGKEVLTNSYLIYEVENVLNNIFHGKKLSTSFEKTIFPKKVSAFIKVGEMTGNIETILSDLSSFYLKELDRKIDKIMTLIEPFFTIIIGGILITLISIFILPVLTQMGELL